MRVWIIHHYALGPDQAGGTRHHRLAKALVNAGHEVLVVAAGRHYQADDDAIEYGDSDEVIRTEDGIRFLRIRTAGHRGNSPRRLVNLLSFAWRVGRSPTLGSLPRPDVIVGSSPQPLAAYAALRWSGRTSAAMVYEVRDLWPESLVAAGAIGAWHPVALLFGWIERRCLARAVRVVTVLPAAGPYLVRAGARPDRMAWIPNGSDSAVQPADERRPGPLRFVYAGAFGYANGLEALIDAAAMLERRRGAGVFEVILYGGGREEASLRRRAESSQVQSVRFGGAVGRREIGIRLADADAFVMILRDSPVFRFGVSPNKLFDYMAAGRPVVYAVRAANDPVSDASAGVVADPRSPESIADAMEAILDLPAGGRRAMGARGRAYQRAHHDMNELGERFVRLVNEAHAQAARRP